MVAANFAQGDCAGFVAFGFAGVCLVCPGSYQYTVDGNILDTHLPLFPLRCLPATGMPTREAKEEKRGVRVGTHRLYSSACSASSSPRSSHPRTAARVFCSCLGVAPCLFVWRFGVFVFGTPLAFLGLSSRYSRPPEGRTRRGVAAWVGWFNRLDMRAREGGDAPLLLKGMGRGTPRWRRGQGMLDALRLLGRG